MKERRMIGRAAIAAMAMAFAVVAQAQVNWIEQGDAGQTIAGSQQVTGSGSLLTISGMLGDGVNVLNDVDIYALNITSVSGFSATLVNSATPTDADSQLFLFDSTGAGVYSNDDTNTSGEFRSTIAAGALPVGLTPGRYYLAVSSYDLDPFNASSVDIFPSGSPTPNPSTGGNVLSSWQFATAGTGDTFAYRVDVTGAAPVPEPATMVALGLGAVAMLKRRRRA